MKNSPLATVSIFFALGIWAAKFIYIPLFLAFVGGALFLLFSLLGWQRNLLFSVNLCLAIFLAGFVHLQNAQTYSIHHISNFVSDNPQKVYLRGKVTNSPEISQTLYGSAKTVFTFLASDLRTKERWQAIEGLIKVTLYGERKVQYGDELLLQGTLVRPPSLRNPGGFDYRRYLANHKIFALLQVKEKDVFLSLRSGLSPVIARRSDTTSIPTKQSQSEEIASGASHPRNDGLLRAILQFKQKLHQIIYQHLEPQQAALLSAILLGERANLSQDIKDLFIHTGTIHILAISGLHIGLIALILIALFRFLRLRRRLSFIFTIFLLSSYALLSGARPAVVRATIIADIVLFGFLINREVKIYNSLGLAALVILISNPHMLFDAGFQLSFLSVISIVYFAPQIERAFPARKGWVYLTRATSVSLAAWLGIIPLVAYYFNIVTPVAVVANLVVIPLLFLVVGVGICFLIFAYLWAPLGAIFAQSSWLSLLGLTRLTALIARIPLGFFRCPRPGIFLFCAYYVLLLLFFNYKKLNLSSGKAGIVLALVANTLVWRPLFKLPSDKLTVTFLDVGGGDATFIEFPYQGTMLIDAGQAGENDAGRWVILPFLWNKGIKKIDACVLTHPDNDHIGGLASVLKSMQVDYVFDNGILKQSISYHNYKTMLAKRLPRYRAIKQGERIFGFPEVKLLVIYPQRPFLVTAGRPDANNNSVVLKLTYKDVSFIFCADIQKQAIARLLPDAPVLRSTIIKVPHHGSDEAEQTDYLFQAVAPEVAVISVDKNNRFGFPAPRVLERLQQRGTQVYKTSDSGAVIISTDGKDIWVKTTVE